MYEDYKNCKFNYIMYKDDAGIEFCPCEILSILDSKFIRIRYYILIKDKKTKEIIDVIIKETICILRDIINK